LRPVLPPPVPRPQGDYLTTLAHALAVLLGLLVGFALRRPKHAPGDGDHRTRGAGAKTCRRPGPVADPIGRWPPGRTAHGTGLAIAAALNVAPLVARTLPFGVSV